MVLRIKKVRRMSVRGYTERKDRRKGVQWSSGGSRRSSASLWIYSGMPPFLLPNILERRRWRWRRTHQVVKATYLETAASMDPPDLL